MRRTFPKKGGEKKPAGNTLPRYLQLQMMNINFILKYYLRM